MPPSSGRIADFHYRTRRRAVVVVAWLMAALFFIGAYTTWLLPTRAEHEWLAFLVFGLLSAVFSVQLLAAQRRQDEVTEGRLSLLLIALGSLGFLQRIAFAYHGELLHDPDVYIFRPILVFFPFLALAAVTLGRARAALRLMWILWTLAVLITMSGLLRQPELDLQRDGLAVMLLWLLLACPLFILLLNTIPPYEHVLKLSQAELAQAQANAQIVEQLRESEQRFRMAVKGLQVGVWEHRLPTDTSPGHWWCSERFFQLLGYQPDELQLSSHNLLNQIDERQRDAISALAQRSLRDGDAFSMDVKVRVKSRRYRSFNVMAHWERDAAGKPVRLTGAISDIHDRVQAEEALMSAKTELQRLAYLDPLTDVSNRRGFDERLALEAGLVRRHGRPLSLLIIDLDHFKPYNDLYGHLSGDESLRAVSSLLQSFVRRPSDLIARIGGEEFAVLLPETPLEAAQAIAERMLRGVYDLNLTHEHSPFGRVTCSIGIACATGTDANAIDLFGSADKALYEAKNGRNQVRTAPLAPPAPPA